jgi:hypothetical protein
MPSIGQTLTTKAGPLPIWAWAGLGTAAAWYFLYQRKKNLQAAANAANNNTSSNLGTVPISNLTTTAQPMPTNVGPIIVDYPPNTTPGGSGTNPCPPLYVLRGGHCVPLGIPSVKQPVGIPKGVDVGPGGVVGGPIRPPASSLQAAAKPTTPTPNFQQPATRTA